MSCLGEKYEECKAWKTDFHNPRRHFLLQTEGRLDVVHLSGSPNNCVVLERGAGQLLTKSHRRGRGWPGEGGKGEKGGDMEWILGLIGAGCWETEVGQGCA